ncbi:MAG TPA: hypothetical protein VF876_11005, partial [Burkholderiales bacterium]
MSHASTADRFAAAAPSKSTPSARARLFLPTVAALLATAWIFSRNADYTPGSALGYNLGLAGGIALLLVILYPLRKRLRFMHAWGASKGWF